jgi:replicative DNA helicase
LDNWGNRKQGALTGVPSGFKKLDDLLSGFQKSDLVILAGRPSMGKTTLALSLARNCAVEYGHKVGIFSLEMSNQQLVERLLTAEARVDSHLVRTGMLPKPEWKKLSRAAGPLSEAQIYIDDSAGLNIMELRAKARQLKVEKEIDILFVDYIQLLSAPSKSESRQQEISYISRSLKALAKELEIPVIALSQLSRAVESRSDHRPIMSDLRESGAIEQDADIIMFIFREYVYSKDDEDFGRGEVIIAKHRNGPTGVVNVSFIDKYARFENLTEAHQEYVNNLPS